MLRQRECEGSRDDGGTLANGGTNPVTGKVVLQSKYVPNVLAVMATAGLYDDSGKWLYTTGLPGKSGVGGGIIAVSPGKFGIAVISPPLDAAGNSVKRAEGDCRGLERARRQSVRGDADEAREIGLAGRSCMGSAGAWPAGLNGVSIMRHGFLTIGLAAALTVSGLAAADGLPRIRVLATGGTIAGAQASATDYGYKSGAYDVNSLLSAVPNLNKLAVITGEQVANIGSQDMNDEIWLRLAKRTNEVLASPDVDGVLITHGTDTLEETAYFLTLVVKSDKPVVMVGSMRPATAISADGPGNIYNGVAVAADPRAKTQGHDGAAERRVPLRAQRRQDRHDQRADVPQPEPGAGRPCAHRHCGVVRADEQEGRLGD